jgi:hypothetical protein
VLGEAIESLAAVDPVCSERLQDSQKHCMSLCLQGPDASIGPWSPKHIHTGEGIRLS